MSVSPPYALLLELVARGWLPTAIQLVILCIVIWAAYQAWCARRAQEKLRELDERLNVEVLNLGEAVVAAGDVLVQNQQQTEALRLQLERHATSSLLHSREAADVP